MSFKRKRLTYVFGLSFLGPVGNWLNGKKTILGLLSLLVYGLIYIAPIVFPECGSICPSVGNGIVEAMGWLGVILTPVGVIHRGVKLKN